MNGGPARQRAPCLAGLQGPDDLAVIPGARTQRRGGNNEKRQ